MKKTFLFFAVAAALSFASCKKDRTCTCTTTSTAAGATPKTKIVDFPKSTKKAAQRDCAISSNFGNGKMPIFTTVEHFDAVGTMPAYTTTTDCKLK